MITISMILFLSLLVLNFFYDDVVALIQCKKCDYDFETEQEICEPDCMGTLCFYSEYYYMNPERVFTRKGCISGMTPSNGCRINQNGQMLCICDVNYCNGNHSALKEEVAAILPYQVCLPEMVNGLQPPPRWTPPCAGNFCTYKRSLFVLENGTIGHSHSKDCSTSSDFDLFYTGLPFLFYPECCAKLEYGGQRDETVCYGSMMDDSTADFTAQALIECHADFGSKNLPYFPFMKLCKGHFCVISASPHGDVYRGCMTLDQQNSERKIAAVQNILTDRRFVLSHKNILQRGMFQPGYYQSYNGMEQWICDSSNCNYDLHRMQDSWPPELTEFKNISRLDIQRLFEEMNTASTTIRGLMFFIILLCTAYFTSN